MSESHRLSGERRADVSRAAIDTLTSGRHAMIIGHSSIGVKVASIVIVVLALLKRLS
jgi:hypothetical protein